jgi:hypothetical protein
LREQEVGVHEDVDRADEFQRFRAGNRDGDDAPPFTRVVGERGNGGNSRGAEFGHGPAPAGLARFFGYLSLCQTILSLDNLRNVQTPNLEDLGMKSLVDWFHTETVTRRRLIGRSLVGLGAAMGGLGMRNAGADVASKGRLRLSGAQSYPPGLEDAATFPLVEALLGRRSRRFAWGASIPNGPLAYTSKRQPAPLSPLEQMLVLTAAVGNTGWHYLIPHHGNYSPKIPNYAGSASGRTFPSGAGLHTTELFYTDDTGTYFLPTRDSGSLVGNETELDLQSYLAAHEKRIRKLSDERLHIPAKPEHMEMHNPWCANVPGSTLLIPVSDLAQHHILNLCYFVQNGVCMHDDVKNRPIPGMNRFTDIVNVDEPYPMTFLEQIAVCEVTTEISTSCYAGMLMLQAVGLGGWLYGGLNPVSILGASGDPDVPGLGFRFDIDERWPMPNVTGLPGVFEGHCPPHFKDMRAAVEAVVQRKFGSNGPFHGKTAGPYKENEKVRSSGLRHDEHFIDCVTTMAQYVFDEYGRFPARIPSIFAFLYLQAHHVDTDFYDEHFGPGAYLHTHANHERRWHTAEG